MFFLDARWSAAWGVCCFMALALVGGSPIPANSQAQGSAGKIAGVSKEMNLAIEQYEKGQDMDAMDGFMEVLTRGDLTERTLANEYINLITQRLALGPDADKHPPVGAAPAHPLHGMPLNPISMERIGVSPSKPPAGLPTRQEAELSRSDREVMKREIEGKIQNRARLAIGQLRRYEDIRIHMANSRVPRAIGLPASLLFDSDVRFKKESTDILDALTELIFSLGATQVVLLPEKALLGDAKILDMRRTMAMSSHFFKAGVSPARVRVNLLNNQIDIPKEFQDYEGILISFVYNQPLPLSTDVAMDAEGGPPTSLGVSPNALDPRDGDGSILEFSVVEPPAGLMSWKFQLLTPPKQAGEGGEVLQDIRGSGPVFHQIFWNGRRNYFGEILPAGRYECLLAATDMHNHTRAKRVWIALQGEAPTVSRPARGVSRLAVVTESSPAPKRVTIQKKRKLSAKKSHRKSKPHAVALVPKKRAEDLTAVSTSAASGETPASPETSSEPAAPQSKTFNWPVLFTKNTTNIAQDGESVLGKVAETMQTYPLDSLRVVGFASAQEADPQALAAKRASFVAELLAKRYRLDSKRIEVQQKVVEAEAYKVEIYFVAGR